MKWMDIMEDPEKRTLLWAAVFLGLAAVAILVIHYQVEKHTPPPPIIGERVT